MSRAQLTSTVEQNTGGAVAPFVAGKNKIINGDFNIWQRGTSFTADPNYSADRWYSIWDGSGTHTITQQPFTAGTAPVAGYESQYFLRYNQSVAGSGATYSFFGQRIEDVRNFAGQTVTVSFWAKAASSIALTAIALNQVFGTGGSSNVQNNASSTPTIGTSWARYTATIALQSISGKTLGAGSYLELGIFMPLNATFTIDIWGVQVEAGSVATPFTTATGTLSGELQACQRYFETSYDTGATIGGTSTTGFVGSPVMATNTGSNIYRALYIPYKVTKRATPTITTYDGLGASGKITTYSSADLSQTHGVTGTADNIGMQNYRVYWLTTNGGAGWHHTISAEL